MHMDGVSVQKRNKIVSLLQMNVRDIIPKKCRLKTVGPGQFAAKNDDLDIAIVFWKIVAKMYPIHNILKARN